MGVPVLVMGESGSGKTFSIRNFKPDEVGIFSVEISVNRATEKMIKKLFEKNA